MQYVKKIMITIEQIKAARALLNLKQSDVAKVAGISLTSLNNIERGVTSPRIATLKVIQKALENAGVEFIANDGVCRRRDTFNVDIFEGKEVVEKYLNDVPETLIDGGTFMVIGNDEENFIQRDKKLFDLYFENLKNKNIKEKVLLCEGDMNFYAEPEVTEYRWMKKEIFSNTPYAVYGNKCSMITWGNPDRLIIIESEAIADSARRQFLEHWNNARVPESLVQ